MTDADMAAQHVAQGQHAAHGGGWEGVTYKQGPEAEAARLAIETLASKMDSMMEQALLHFESRSTRGDQLLQLWSVLLGIFERSLLLTHRSKFTQFLLFYLCSRAPDPCCEQLLNLLLSK